MWGYAQVGAMSDIAGWSRIRETESWTPQISANDVAWILATMISPI